MASKKDKEAKDHLDPKDRNKTIGRRRTLEKKPGPPKDQKSGPAIKVSPPEKKDKSEEEVVVVAGAVSRKLTSSGSANSIPKTEDKETGSEKERKEKKSKKPPPSDTPSTMIKLGSVSSDSLTGKDTKAKKTPSSRHLSSTKEEAKSRKDQPKTPKKGKEGKGLDSARKPSFEIKKDAHKEEPKKEEAKQEPKNEHVKKEEKPEPKKEEKQEPKDDTITKSPSKNAENLTRPGSTSKPRGRPERPEGREKRIMRKKEEEKPPVVAEVRQSTLTKGKTVRATIPSDPNEVKAQFEKVMEAMGVAPKTRDDMRKMGLEAQWMFVLSNQQRVQALMTAQKEKETVHPETYIEALKNPKKMLADNVRSLKAELNSRTGAWIDEFREKGGVSEICNALNFHEQVKHKSAETGEVQVELLNVLKLLMNNRSCLDQLIFSKDCLNLIALSGGSPFPDVKHLVYEIFSAILVLRSEDGYKPVVEAIDFFTYHMQEARFTTLMNALKHEDSKKIKKTLLIFINCLISTPEELDDRIEIRNELLRLGLEGVLNKLRDDVNSGAEIEEQIKEYDADYQQDIAEFKAVVAELNKQAKNLNLEDPMSIYNAVQKRVGQKEYLKKPFVDIMQRMLLLPLDHDTGYKKWLILDKVIHYMSNDTKDEIRFDSSTKVDLDALLMSTEDIVEMDKERDQFFTVKAQLEDTVKKLQKKLDELELDVKEKNEKLTNFEKEYNQKIRAKMEEHAAEAVKLKLEDLNKETEKLRVREQELRLQERDLGEKLLKTENNLVTKEREVQTLKKQISDFTIEEDTKFKKLRSSHDDQVKLLNDELNTNKEKVLELQKEVEKTRKEGQELNRKKMVVFKENLDGEHKKEMENLENKHKEKINELRDRHTQALKKSLQDLRDELESQASTISSAAKNTEGQLEKMQSVLNQRKAEIEKLVQQVEEDRSKIEQKDSQIVQFQKNNENLQKMLDEERSRARIKIVGFETDKERLEKDINQIKDELNQTKSQVSYTKQKAKIKKDQVKKKHLEEITAKTSELEDTKRMFETTKAQMKVQIDKANDALEEERNNSIKKSRQQDDVFILEKEKLQRKVLELTNQLEDAQQSIEFTVGERTKLFEVEKMKTTRTIDQLKQQLSEKVDEVGQLQKKYHQERTSLGSELVQLKELLNKTTHDKDDLTNELKKAENEIEKLKRETVMGNRNQLLEQIEALKTENSVLKNEVTELERDLNTSNLLVLTTQIEDIKEQLDNTKEELAQAKTESIRAKEKSDKLNERFTVLNNEANDLRDKLTEAQRNLEEGEKLKEKMNEAERNIKNLRSDLQDKSDSFNKVNTQFTEITQKWETLKVEQDNTVKKLNKVELELKEAANTASLFQGLKAEHELTVVELNKQKMENTTTNANLQLLTQKLEASKKEIEQVTKDLQSARSAVSGSDSAKKTIEQLNENMSRVTKALEEKTKLLDQANTSLTTIESEQKQFKSQFDELQKSLAQKELSHSENEKENAKKSIQIDQFEQDISKLNLEIKKLQTELDSRREMETSVLQLRKDLESAQADKLKLEGDIKTTEREKKIAQMKVDTVSKKSRQEIEELNRKNETLKEENETLTDERDRLQTKLDKLDSTLKDKSNDMTHELVDMKDENIKLTAKIADLKVKLETAEIAQEKSKQLFSKITEVERDRDELAKANRELKSDTATLNKDRDNLMASIAELKAAAKTPVTDTAQVEKLTKEVNSLRTQVETLRKQLADNATLPTANTAPLSVPAPPSIGSPPPIPPSSGPPPPPGGGGPPPPPGGMGGPPPPPGMGGPPPLPGRGPPPPPGMGGPPPPPGMGGPPPFPGRGGPSASILQWKGPKPKVPMKAVQWAKMPNQKINKTVFKDLKADNLEIDTKLLEKLFAAAEPEEKKKDKDGKKEAPKEIAVSLVESKRQTNVGIFLKTFKMPVEELEEAILTLNEDVLTLENVTKLLDNLPEPEEVTAIKGWLEADPVNNLLAKLSPVDQFFLGLSKIPQLRARMECLQYKLQFPIKVGEVKPALLRIRQATTTMQNNSENFLKLVEIILALGNFLNSGTAKGNAIGFSLRSLEKLHDTRGTEKNTLLTFLIEYVEDKKPDISNWTKELANVKYAIKVTYESIQDDIKELQGGLKTSEQKIGTVNRSESRWDVFYKLMPASIEECRKEFEEVDTLNTSVFKDFSELVEKYGEDPARTKPEEFFNIINNFLTQYENLTKDIKLKRIQDEKEKKKKELEAKKEAKKKELEERRQRQEARKTGATAPTAGATSTTAPTTAPTTASTTASTTAAPTSAAGARRAGGAGARVAASTRAEEPPEPKDEPPESKEEDTAELVDNAISAMNSGRAFARRRLRRQDTLRQKQEESAKYDVES